MYSQPVIQAIPFTADAYRDLQSEFDRLSEERVQLLVRLQTAREMGDLSENGAYKYAKIELGDVNRRLRELNHHGYVVQKQANPQTVQFGSTVTVQQGKRVLSYMIVSQHESNPQQGKLSTESPIGQALFGKKKGDTITVNAPTGRVEYKIVDLQ